MGKLLLHILILFTFFQSSTNGQFDKIGSRKRNYIDSIQYAKQITDLIFKINGRYKDFKVNDKLMFAQKNCQKLSDSLKIQPWTKADFDNNGLTDILVIGNWFDHSVICILDKDGKYEIKRISQSFEECTFPIVENTKIKYYFESEPERGEQGEQRKLKHITLIYKFGNFIEENQKPSSHKIDRIEYSTTRCFGTCPVFKLTINSDKTAEWYAEEHNKINNKEVSGNFNSKITEDRYNEIMNLLNYIDFDKLKDNYAVDWTDDTSSTLKITYDNGKIKSIDDYGLIGTYGLIGVYKLIFDLRENQKWTK